MFLKVLEKKPETDQVFSLILEKPTGFTFYPGQYLDIKLPVKDPNGNTRAFTISSSPTENFLMVTPKKGLSKYKKFMESLKIGDVINTSHPAGTFTLDESTPAMFIAGGIGITPFRSIIKYAGDHKLKTSITLVYSNSDDHFLFKDELDKWQKKLPNLKVIYIITSRDARLDKPGFLKLYPIPYTLTPIYYLAGPPKMVDDFETMLLELGVDETNIRFDRFDGYL